MIFRLESKIFMAEILLLKWQRRKWWLDLPKRTLFVLTKPLVIVSLSMVEATPYVFRCFVFHSRLFFIDHIVGLKLFKFCLKKYSVCWVIKNVIHWFGTTIIAFSKTKTRTDKIHVTSGIPQIWHLKNLEGVCV